MIILNYNIDTVFIKEVHILSVEINNKFAYYIKNNLHIIILFLITILSFTLNFYAISNYGYGNEYYSASVLSMTKSLKNFFFISFDPTGMLAIDKPPLGLWIQAIFVMILGFKGWVMILPQAISSTLCCILIYILMRKNFNYKTSLLSSFIFAITPIVVAVSRNNTMDMQLVFILLLSIYTFLKIFEKNKKKYIFITAILVGIGFNIKMFQAYLILPSFALTYLFFYKEPLHKKFITGFLACFLMLVVSLSWVTFVEFYPKENRPYIDSTSTNSVYELIFEHNGIERLVGESKIYNPSSYFEDNETNNNNPNNDSIGEPSIFRLWNNNIYGQISWLLILTFMSIIPYNKKLNFKKSDSKNIFFIFWEIYFLSMFIFFSFAGFYHRYYLCMIAPSIAILSSIGLEKMFLEHISRSTWKQYLLPVSLSITMILEFRYVLKDETSPILLIILTITLFLISIYFFISKSKSTSIVLILCVMLIMPFYWALTPVIYVPNLTKPSAGPSLKSLDTLSIDSKKDTTPTIMSNNFALEEYLLSNYEKDSFLLVSRKTSDVSHLIISTGLPCYAYGGFLGENNSLDIAKLKELVINKKITYFLIDSEDDSPIAKYVRENAKLIEESEYTASFSQFNNNMNNKNKFLYSFKES